MNERPLGKITALLAELGLEVTYAYDDLVFVQHSALLLQFTEVPTHLKLFTHTECDAEEVGDVVKQVVAALTHADFSVVPSGSFSVAANEDETISLTFS